MSANVTVVLSSETGFSSGIPSDAYGFITDPILLSRALKSAWEGSTISVDISYSAEVDLDGTGNLTSAVISNNQSSYDFAAVGLTYTKLTDSTARISGKTANLFPGAYYRFRMPDGTFKVLPPDTTEEFYALVEYNMPTPTSRDESYPVTISIDAAGIEPKQNVTINLTESHYWNYSSAVENVKSLAKRGIQ